MATKRQSLGKGLDALLGIAEDINASQGIAADGVPLVDGKLQQLPVELLQRGQYQPRRDFNADSLQELADSIASQGLIQPIVAVSYTHLTLPTNSRV